MAEFKIKPDSFLNGLIHSDLDAFLLYRYDELISKLYQLFGGRKNKKGTAEVFDKITNSLKSKNADSKRIIKSLDLLVKNETIPANEISLNQIRKNNLEAIVEKTECLIDDLTIIRNEIGIGKPTKDKDMPTTYIWHTNSVEELPKLYNLMNGKFIAETDFESFRAIFTGQPIQSTKPLRWHDDNASELLYFNHSLRNKVNPVKNLYQRMKSCFVKPDGESFTNAFPSLFQGIDINLSNKKQQAINQLIENL